MHDEASLYVQRFMTREPISVIEIGSRDINGTARVWFPSAKWTGLDVVEGPRVDVVIDAEEYEPPNTVDMVVCCEVFEHTPRWRQILRKAATWLNPGGRLLVTCAGPGRQPHSAADGGELRDGEHYENVSADDLAACLTDIGLTEIDCETQDNDTYGTARRVQGPTLQTHENVLPEWIRLAAVAEFPGESWPWWHRYENGKLASVDPFRLPSGCMFALQELARRIEPPAGSFWDLDFHGAGLHLMPSGTHLGRHLDAEHHPQKPLKRIASLVYFPESVGGGNLIVGESVISPRENTAALFTCDQWHEVSTTLDTRRTLSLFAWRKDDGPKTRLRAHFVDT